VSFDPWQDQVGGLILAKRSDGMLASTVDGVGMSLPRQVGKTYLIAALTFALCVNMPGLLVIWTAHHLGTSGETFLALQGFAERSRVKPHVKQIFTGSGDEEIRFHNGSRILFGARERGFGRGIPGVDILIFDEAQILSDKAMANMLATMNTSRFGLHLYVGTPPKPEDMSESFTRMRTQAYEGTLVDGAWVEFGADPKADPNDRKQWAKANPSYPHRTPPQSILRLQRKLTEADFRREGMGIWDDDGPKVPRAIPVDKFDELKVETGPEGVRSYGVKFSVDGLSVALSVGVKPAEGGPVHVETVKYLPASQSGELVPWLAERWRDAAAIVIDGKAGAGALEAALRAEKVSAKVIIRPTADQYTAAHKTLLDAITAERLSWFEGDEHLSTAVTHAVKRDIGNLGGWGWGSSSELVDITPLDSATLAHYGAVTSKRVPGRKQVLL